MSKFGRFLAASALASAFATSAMAENNFDYAFQGTLKSLDPYTLRETFTLGILTNVYEGLIKRGPNLEILPGLATSWEVIEPTRWRFHLRQGVKFHNGNDFTAEDVVFSAERLNSEGSDMKGRVPVDATFEIVDDYTVDVILASPNPILHYEWELWSIIDKDWAEANDSVRVTSSSDTAETPISLMANGTGPFKISEHTAGVNTKFEANENWWNWENREFNIDTVNFTSISADATRVAALLSGEMDMVYPVPTQDIKRIDASSTLAALTGPELRTIFLGMDQSRDELLNSSVTGKNPFKDIRVRQAFYHAINAEAITARIMRKQAAPSALMISPFLFDNADQFERLAYDPDKAKALLAEAGYPDGFEIRIDCPNDRYVNDESICQAVAAMMAKVGVKVNVNAQPKAQYFAKILASGGYETSFYLLGWTPGSLDSHNIFANLYGCRDDAGKGGMFNIGGYCNPEVDALAKEILVENDAAKRLDLVTQAYKIVTDEVGYLPLHQQGLAWGVSKDVNVAQRADNVLRFEHITKN